MIHPIIKSYGSKWALARRGVYPEPVNDTIVSRFAGGAGYECNYPEHQVILVEKDPDVYGAWKWVLSASFSEIASLPVDIPVGTDLRTIGLAHGAACLIRTWQRLGRNDCWTVSVWNGKPGMWCASTRDRIARDVERIRHWEVLCGHWSEFAITPKIRTEFIDPPYQHNKGYRHQGVDYAMLCREWRNRGCQVIVCEQKGADWLPFRELTTVNAGCAHHPKKQSTEMIWP